MADIDGKSVSMIENSLRNISTTATTLIPSLNTIAGIFAGSTIASSLVNLGNYEKQFKKLSYQMGDANKKSKEYLKNVYSISKATGAATADVAALQEQLIKARIKGTEALRFLSKQTLFFQEITGASADTAGRLTGELSRMGRVSPKSINSILTGIVKVQRAYGMTNEEVNQLAEGIVSTTATLSAMGKSASFVEGFSKGLTKLTGGFASVGLEAGKAASLVERLLDPDQLEDNALLYSKLGISMEDAISGNIDPSDLQAKLKGLGSELKAMGRPAGAALARQMGMNYGELLRMTEMQETAIDSGGKGLEGMAKEQRTWFESLEKGLTSFGSGIMGKFIDLIGNPKRFGIIIGAVIGGGLILAAIGFGRKMKSVATDFSNTINQGIVGALGMKYDRKGTIKSQRAAAGERASMVDISSGESGETIDLIKRSKLRKYLNNLEDQNYKTISNKLTILKNEREVFDQTNKMAIQQLEANNRTLQARAEFLKNGPEFIKVEKQRIKNLKEIDKLTTASLKIHRMDTDIQKHINRLSIKEKKELSDKFLLEKQMAESKIKTNNGLIKTAKENIELLEKELKTSKSITKTLELRKLLEGEKLHLGGLETEKAEAITSARTSRKASMAISGGIKIAEGEIPIVRGLKGVFASFAKRLPTTEGLKNMGLNALKGAGSALKNVGKFALMGMLPMMLMSKILPKLQPLIDLMLNSLGPLFDAIAKIAFNLIKMLGPAILTAMAKIIPIIMKLTNFMVWALGGIFDFLTLGAFHDQISNFTEAIKFKDDDINSIEKSLLDAADALGKIEFNSNPENIKEGEGTVLNATKSGFVVNTGTRATSAGKDSLEGKTYSEMIKIREASEERNKIAREEIDLKIKEMEIEKANTVIEKFGADRKVGGFF